MYSKEDIERKRLEALRKKQQKVAGSPAAVASPSTSVLNPSFQNQNQPRNLNSGTSYSSNAQNNNYGYGSRNNNFQNKSQGSFKQQNISNRFNPMQRVNNFYSNQNSQPDCEASCSMISCNRFSVDTSTYNQKLIELFKTIPTKAYDAKTRTWNFHIVDYELLQEKIINLKTEVTFKGIPTFVYKTFKNLSAREKQPKKEIDLSQIDPTLLSSLYPFQREGIEFGILQNGKCIIADDMGLGKTRQALGIAHYYKKNWPLIIVSPSSVRYQWSEAIMENLPTVPVQYIQQVTSTKDFVEKSQVTVISYDLLARRIDEFSARKYGVIICDESHYLKSGKTQRSKAVQRLVANAQNLILLTGTPALSRPIELFFQVKLVMPSFMSYKDFGIRYCAGVQNKFGWDFSGSSNLKELDFLLKACCLIRRLKSDVLKQLPSKIRQKIILDPHLIKGATKEMEAASRELEQDNLKGLEKQSALLQYYSISSKAKEKAVCNYIADLLENEQKFLVFAHHKSMLDAVSNLLISKKIKYIRIDGQTNAEQRKHFVDKFQEDGKTMVAVLSITAANAGITLTAAQLVIFAELSWNPGILSQAEDRVHRIGQTDNVVIRYLLAKDTVDDYMWPAIQEKIEVLNEVGLDQNFDLNQADVENQKSHMPPNQQTMDQFLISPNKSSTNSSDVEPSGSADLKVENMKDLLDVDDDAFDDIDLDNIM